MIRAMKALFACGTAIAILLLPRTGQAADVDFAHEIAPLLKQQCGKCHTGDQKKGNFSLNTRESLMSGGESGKAVVAGKSGESELVERLTSNEENFRMPPEGPRMPAEKVALIRKWIDEGVRWEDGFTFGQQRYEPPLKPRRPELPKAVAGRQNPIDRIIDSYLAKKKLPMPQPIDDATFLRRASLDLVGLLPTPEELDTFLADRDPQKRAQLVQALLARDVDYAEHWLTFWNDLLRNDYTGTGFITGGRKQISKWLYDALVMNKPYDQFARELIAPPTPESAGFGEGIRWRGEVSAGQTVEIQFAQSVGQSFLGINLKCASCHDSFIDRWKLTDSYGLAAIYSQRALDIHRCDKPIGQTAKAGWLFPELGQVDPQAAQPERLKQLANLMTHPENGRFTRTIVNRLWHRMMGRGIVHPTDAMQTEPWDNDLLDYLAVHLADSHYDLKQTLALIADSQAYQSQSQLVAKGTDDRGYTYAGPRAKRMTAEQFLDAVWQLTGAAPAKIDAPVIRGKPDPEQAAQQPLAGKWIWAYADTSASPANETIAFHKTWTLDAAPRQATGAITCDNSYTIYVNGQKVDAGDNWEQPHALLLTSRLKKGVNEVLIVGKNGGAGPNPAALYCELQAQLPDGKTVSLGTDSSWEWTRTLPGGNGKFDKAPTDWQPAQVAKQADIWNPRVGPEIARILSRGGSSGGLMVRASLVKSDFLMRSLGRPNRDQIVSVRPDELTTLEAMDLSNGAILADTLTRGSKLLLARNWESPEAFVRWLYRFALSRDPQPGELAAAKESLGDKLTPEGIEDVLWAVIMLPEFQLVR